MIRSDTKRQPERPYTAPPRRGPPRAAKKLRLRPRACPAAPSAPVNRRDCAHAGKCCCIAAAAHIVYLGLWRFLGAALLGVMRFIERPVARALCCWLSAASQVKTQDSYKNELAMMKQLSSGADQPNKRTTLTTHQTLVDSQTAPKSVLSKQKTLVQQPKLAQKQVSAPKSTHDDKLIVLDGG